MTMSFSVDCGWPFASCAWSRPGTLLVWSCGAGASCANDGAASASAPSAVEAASTAGHVYGESHGATADPGFTPTRLLTGAPTPSANLGDPVDDLHVPAIIRMTQGRLPIE